MRRPHGYFQPFAARALNSPLPDAGPI